jgi:hypothetical protein
MNKADRLKAVRSAFMNKAKRARTNLVDFYEMVMRDETTRARLKAAPHQVVVMKFVMDHPRCVLRLPPGFSKTYILSALTMFMLGNDVTTRGAIVSGATGQSKKPLAMVRDYIEKSPDIRLVFPHLVPSQHSADPWTQTAITVNRPSGIRDPSLTAVGYRGKLPGSRLSWLFIDDLLTMENTAVPEMRESVISWVMNSVLSRRDVVGARCVVSNTPYHPEDLTYELQKAGWPTLEMTISGDIRIHNSDDWDCDEIRRSKVSKDEVLRLTAHDHPKYDPAQEHLPETDRLGTFFDDADEVPLWPEKFGEAAIQGLKNDYASRLHEYFRLYEMKVRTDEDSAVKVEWIEACKARARQMGIYTMSQSWQEGRTFTGVDLAIGKKRKSGRTSVFTFGLMPDKSRVILRISAGRWSGTEIINKVFEHHTDFKSIVRVETNAAQDFLRQWMLTMNRAIPVKSHTTGANKHSKEHGVESLFIEIENGAWLIPNDQSGRCEAEIQTFINEVLYYNPAAHTGDTLMACWLARVQAGRSAA